MTPASVTTPREKSTTIRGVVGRIVVLSLTLVSAIYLVPLLITYRMWLWLGVVLLATAAMFLLYSTKRFVPAKYLFPGLSHHPNHPDYPDLLHQLRGRLPWDEGGSDHRHHQ